jgi:serine/threonine protein kinase
LSGLYDAGQILRGRFEIKRVLKSSSLSNVYLGYDKQTEKKVVIKCPSYSDGNTWKDAVKLERLKVESEILRSLNHPYVVRYVDSWDDGGDYHLVMEYVDARSMKETCECTTSSIEETIEYVLELLEVAEYLHYKGIVHRDIKPANILLDHHIVLVDFGAAEAKHLSFHHREVTIGTPGYQCPESFKGTVSPQCDIYSIGATLLFLLTGEKPSGDFERFRTRTRHEGLLNIALKAMESFPGNRFKTAFEMKRNLQYVSNSNTPRIIIGNKRYVLDKDRVEIGRDDNADVVVEDPKKFVSPLHAEICKDGSQFCLINRSINGTYIYRNENYNKIDKWYLNDGETIALCYNPIKGPYRLLKFRM